VPVVPKTVLELLNDATELANKFNDEKIVLTKQLAQIGNHLAGSTISELGDDMMFNVVAKLLSTNLEINLGQNTLMCILRSKGWLMVGRSYYEKNMPMQNKIDYMRVYLHVNEITGKINATTVLRPKGLKVLSTKISKWYVERLNVERASLGICPRPPNYKDNKR
jgi:phage antirepressor YoqD-like protein